MFCRNGTWSAEWPNCRFNGTTTTLTTVSPPTRTSYIPPTDTSTIPNPESVKRPSMPVWAIVLASVGGSVFLLLLIGGASFAAFIIYKNKRDQSHTSFSVGNQVPYINDNEKEKQSFEMKFSS